MQGRIRPPAGRVDQGGTRKNLLANFSPSPNAAEGVPRNVETSG